MKTYLLINGQQAGPFDAAEIAQLMFDGTITQETQAWTKGQLDWMPLHAIFDFETQPAKVQPTPVPESAAPHIEKQTAKNSGGSALLAGFVCCILACLLMWMSYLWLYFYVPLFFVSFILSICAMAQGKPGEGILLLGATLILPLVVVLSSILSIGNSVSPSPVAAAPVISASPAPPLTPAATPVANPAPPLPPKSPFPALDAKMGFRGYKLGTKEPGSPPADLTPKFFSGLDEDSYNASLNGTQSSMPLTGIVVTFKEKLLSNIAVSTDSLDNSIILREALTKAYGTPVATESSGFFGTTKTYEWKGDHCDLIFAINPSGAGDAEFTSPDVQKKIDDIIAKAEAERQKEADDKIKQAQSAAVTNSTNL